MTLPGGEPGVPVLQVRHVRPHLLVGSSKQPGDGHAVFSGPQGRGRGVEVTHFARGYCLLLRGRCPACTPTSFPPGRKKTDSLGTETHRKTIPHPTGSRRKPNQTTKKKRGRCGQTFQSRTPGIYFASASIRIYLISAREQKKGGKPRLHPPPKMP